MADTRFYASDVQMPIIDYGAIYENAKAKREEADMRKLQYLNSFQKERGAFAPGVQGEIQSMWNKLQEDLNGGDMSFEAMARRQQMYNDYKDQAAVALEWSSKLNDYEASILADPSQYNTPDVLLQKIQEDRSRPVPISQLGTELSSYPSLGTFRRFSMAEMSPNAAAQTILSQLKTGGGIQNFYDMDGAGGLRPEVVDQTVLDFFGVNSLSQDEEDQAIAFILRSKGALSGSVSDIEKVRKLNDEQRAQYMNEYASYVSKNLSSLIANDIQTQKEEEAAKLRMLRTQSAIRSSGTRPTGTSSQGSLYPIQYGPIEYTPPITEVASGGVPKMGTNPPITDNRFIMSSKISGTQPSYTDVTGTKRYIEQATLDGAGNPYVLVRFSQKALNPSTGKMETVTVRDIVPWDEVLYGSGSGLSNEKQAGAIQSVFQRMGVEYGNMDPQQRAASQLSALQSDVDSQIAQQQNQSGTAPAPVEDEGGFFGNLWGGIKGLFGSTDIRGGGVNK